MDPVLHDIYSKETASHLTEIRDYLRKRAGQAAPHPLPESVYRAIHTLSGSSKMAEARQGVRITEPLNRYMRKVFDSGQGLSDDGLATLSQAVGAIENVVSHIDENSAFFPEQPSLLARLQALESELDAALAHLSLIHICHSRLFLGGERGLDELPQQRFGQVGRDLEPLCGGARAQDHFAFAGKVPGRLAGGALHFRHLLAQTLAARDQLHEPCVELGQFGSQVIQVHAHSPCRSASPFTGTSPGLQAQTPQSRLPSAHGLAPSGPAAGQSAGAPR